MDKDASTRITNCLCQVFDVLEIKKHSQVWNQVDESIKSTKIFEFLE